MAESIEKLRSNYSEACMAQVNLAGDETAIRATAISHAAVEIHWLDRNGAEIYFAGQKAEANARAFLADMEAISG